MGITEIIESSRAMTDKEKLKLAAELADAADVVQQSVKVKHEDMFSMHVDLGGISDDLFELANNRN